MKTLLLGTCIVAFSTSAFAQNAYEQTHLIANKASYKPTIAVDKKLINAWGIAIRPAGAGGHFWVTGADVSFEYVGDVSASKDEALRTLHTDDLKYVKLPVGGKENFSTGVVFNDSKEHFTITQKVGDLEPITAPAKFMFASDGGIISAWTERKKEDGTFDRPTKAISVIDESKDGAAFFGLAISSKYNRLYAADFGAAPAIKVYDGTFKREDVRFDMPFDENKNDKVDAGEYAPFNIQALKTPAGENRIFVAYAKTQICPAEEVQKKTCADGELFVGEEDTSKAGYGRVAEFTENGKLVAVWKDGGKLSAPWGMVYAPSDFGALSGTLLVANFGDGTIAAFDAATREFKDVMRDKAGKPIAIDKVWGILFGNGESLGDKNALYFAAGPKDEADGVFGSLRPLAQ
jgi:uncharacterized protein (TIGR03118 family)